MAPVAPVFSSKELSDALQRFFEVAVVEAVSSPWYFHESGIIVTLYCAARVANRHHIVGIAMHDEHRSAVGFHPALSTSMSRSSMKKRRPMGTCHTFVVSGIDAVCG